MAAVPATFRTDADLLERYSRDMVYQGRPDYVCPAGDWREVAEILAWCDANRMPVTVCGSQTSMTGASVPDGGVVIPLANRARILDIGRDPGSGTPFVLTEPGVLLGELKRTVAVQGFFYPPDPTSFQEAQTGATVATNATGEETFRFGPTRWYVQELDVLKSDGTPVTLRRSRPPAHTLIKNTAGYWLEGEPIDQLIGSEGTLGLITRLKLRLLENIPQNVFVLILPFARFENCLKAVTRLAESAHRPRALELIGPGAGAYFQQCPACPEELKTDGIFLYIKDDYADEGELEAKITAWFGDLSDLYAELGETAALERVFVARTDAQLSAIRECRHYIPLKVNEEYFPLVAQGGGKVGTDWWVPRPHLLPMMLKTYAAAQDLKIPFLVFAHIGNGHPHWNFLTRTPGEKAVARQFVADQCRQAVALGGGVAGEHGIGKIKRNLLPIQHTPETINRMIAVKEKWDPHWILGRGNLFRPRS